MAASRAGARPRTLAGRLLLWYGLAVLALLLILSVVVDRVLEGYFVDQLTEALVADARAAQTTLPSAGSIEDEVIRLGRAIGARITLIGTDGVVLADSEHDPATMENHLGRPEVRQALGGSVGVADRSSATLGIPFRYVALPPADGRIVRVALALTDVRSRLNTIRVIVGIGVAAAAVIGLIILALIARSLSGPMRRAAAQMDRVADGDLAAAIPEEGTDELVALARAVNRMRAEVASRIQELQEERSTRDAVLSRLDEGVMLFDLDGTVRYQNDSAQRLLGPIDRAPQLVPASLRETVEAAGRESARRATEVTGPGPRALAVAAVPISGDGGVLMVIRDVTEARAVDAVRRDFVANASHELKTPAASIRALAETIQAASGDDPESVPRFAGKLEREAVRLSRIISDLLDLSRLEGETGELGDVRLDRLVASEARRVAQDGERAGLELTVDTVQPVLVRGSSRDLGLLVRNLLDNAVQYTRPGGRVSVRVGSEDRMAVLVVEDTGIGIPQKEQARVFERFYRVDRARSRETGGTGLGLSLVRHVAENHGGRVTLESRLGEGSSFTVRLPLAERPDRPARS